MKTWKYIHIDECPSTNLYSKELRNNKQLTDKTAILSDFQSAGKGQNKNLWHSKPEKNLLCSFYKETSLKAENHFLLNMVVSLSLIELLKEYNISAQIKWPNDIYVHNSKIAGILIENSLLQATITNSIIGIGLNINQEEFPDWIPNPTSMCAISGTKYDIREIMYKLGDLLLHHLLLLDKISDYQQDIIHRYLKVLYRINNWHVFRMKDHNFNGIIHGVLPDGRLILESGDGKIQHFSFGEIEYVI